jgi:hypothetical protein
MESKESTGNQTEEHGSKKRLPPVAIPLPFERAVEGLLAVDPKAPVRQRAEKKKPRTKK